MSAAQIEIREQLKTMKPVEKMNFEPYREGPLTFANSLAALSLGPLWGGELAGSDEGGAAMGPNRSSAAQGASQPQTSLGLAYPALTRVAQALAHGIAGLKVRTQWGTPARSIETETMRLSGTDSQPADSQPTDSQTTPTANGIQAAALRSLLVRGAHACGSLLRRHMDRMGNSHGRLAVIERIQLAPRQSLALVEFEGQRLLVATSPQGGASFFALDARENSAAQRTDAGRRSGARIRPFNPVIHPANSEHDRISARRISW